MSRQSHKILVVIPDKSLLTLAGEVLSFSNYTPLLAINEENAIEICEQEDSIAVVVVDWELSKRHFPALLKRLKVLSSYMGRFVLIDDDDVEINKLRVNDEFCCCMKKPFALEAFEQGIAGCVREYALAKENCQCAEN
jgi:DNA-binding NtrC family response regulator